ncbi:sensor histidine kinase [Poseidonibacter lekithochrous]|uniref:sensor histidine kinase n=1 Tax=Poseidonibacter lekithochrous TaxID=1904463 RepID=UPI0008FC4AF2|nr:sensor histidine kinase [Poseidonibacter lekithochrous]QKJ22502.1 7TMR-DISM-7TM domain-containing two-component system sensor histidine kinase [Poseidonibacter lekithochrous]
MFRVFIYVFLFISFLDASIIKKVEVFESTDRSLSVEDIKESKKFKRTKLPFIRASSNIFFLRVTFDKSKLDDELYSVELDTEFNNISVEKDIKYLDIYKNKVLDQSLDSFTETIYIKLNNIDDYVNFNIFVSESNDYAFKQILLSKFFGVAYGIVFAAFLYYIAFFIFNREKTYIYYALTQLSMLGILLFLSYREIENDRFYMDIIFFSFYLFSNLFTKSFLNTKVNTPIIDKILTYSIFLYTLDMLSGWIFNFYFMADMMPLSTLLIVYLIAGYVVYNQGYKPALFYLISWSIMVFSFLFIEFQFYFTTQELFIKPNYIIHVIAPLESLILAFALSYKMKILEEEKLQQQEFLTHQSKLASMGEMIGNIAHQWRQPLTHLSYIMMNLKTAFERDKLTSEYFDKKSIEAKNQLEFMSHTIDDFRDFFKVSKEKELFSLKIAIDEVINLLSASLNSYEIEVKFTYEKDIEIKSLRGELLQVIFNILNNAKDEFIRKDTSNPIINIHLYKEKKNIFIEISDNAGGIKNEILQKVFEPYFTTKDKGLGIGLYMSKMIIEKNIAGKLDVSNIEEGALFSIKIPNK